MIEITLNPQNIFIEQRSQLFLHLFNRGPGDCFDVRLGFRFSPEIHFVRNDRRIEREILREGKNYEHEMTVVAYQIGDFALTSESFSYENGQGIHKEQFSIPIRVMTAWQLVTTPKINPAETITISHRMGRFDIEKLRQNLINCFSLEDMRTLCFKLGFNYESIEHTKLEACAREIIIYCKRHGKLVSLVQICQSERPHIDWD